MILDSVVKQISKYILVIIQVTNIDIIILKIYLNLNSCELIIMKFIIFLKKYHNLLDHSAIRLILHIITKKYNISLSYKVVVVYKLERNTFKGPLINIINIDFSNK